MIFWERKNNTIKSTNNKYEINKIWNNYLKYKNHNKLDISCVVSAGDRETSELRIEKALKTYYDKDAKIFLLNGFNSPGQHDEGWEGESWRDDSRLINIKKDLDKISSNLYVVYAKNSVENMAQLKDFMYSYGKFRTEITTSETHLKRLMMIGYHTFFDDEFWNLSFSASKEPNERLKKYREIKEKMDCFLTSIILSSIERGDPNISRKYNNIRYSSPFKEIYNLKIYLELLDKKIFKLN